MPSSSASFCNWYFHSRTREPLLPPSISRDRQTAGAGVLLVANLVPPTADRLHCEGGRVMVDPDADPACSCGKIIDAIRHRTAQLLDQKIMYPNLFGIAPRAPLPSAILKVVNQFLLLRVDRDHGLLTGQHACHALIVVGELGIAIRMAVPLARLAVALQAELLLFEHFTNDGVTDPMAKGAQFGCKTPG